jgi:hypothetical protein
MVDWRSEHLFGHGFLVEVNAALRARNWQMGWMRSDCTGCVAQFPLDDRPRAHLWDPCNSASFPDRRFDPHLQRVRPVCVPFRGGCISRPD